MKKLSLAAKCVLLIPVAAAAGIALYGLQGTPLSAENSIGKGFSPGTIVSYEMISAGHKDAGRITVGKNGEVKLPPMDLTQNPSDLAYNLTIQPPRREPYDLALHVDQKKGKVSLKGTGWEQFAAVNMETGKQSLAIKADWAGMFDEHDAANISDLKTAPVRLAFQSLDLARGAHAPYIQIQALGPQGRGGECDNTQDGKNCSDVNKYTPTGPSNLSTYDAAAMKEHINNVKQNFDMAFQKMSGEMSTSMAQNAQIVGSFIDARMQLDTQRQFQETAARAHATYHPGEQMCRFGTFVRSVYATQQQMDKNRDALDKSLMGRYLNEKGGAGSAGIDADAHANEDQFKKSYCDKDSSGGDCPRPNHDIDFTSVVGAPLTLDIDFLDSSGTADEEDVMALAKNLYWPTPLATTSKEDVAAKSENYINQRALMALTNVAHNTFINQVAEKSRSPGDDPDQGPAFMKAMMREFKMSDDDINALLGNHPSYYAQMEVLTKKIYQSPNFYTSLYERPADVERIATAMDAIKLMQGRDRFESTLRREMLTSLLLEQALKKPQEQVSARILSGMKAPQSQ